MTETTNKQWRSAVLLDRSQQPEGNIWRTNRLNQIFLCQFQHSDEEGLIEVFIRHTEATGFCAFQFSSAGEVLGILRVRPDGPEEIEFDRDQGIGDSGKAADRGNALLHGLGIAIER